MEVEPSSSVGDLDFIPVKDAVVRSISDEGKIKLAYEDLVDAFSESNLSDAIDLCRKYPRLLTKTLPNDRLVLNELIKLGGCDHDKEVVDILWPSDELWNCLSERKKFDITPLEVAARVGAIQIAICLVQKVPKLLFQIGAQGLTPLAVAIGSRRNVMANLLYDLAPQDFFWTDDNAHTTATVITKSFEAENLVIPLKLLESCPKKFILAKDIFGKSPLCTAASAPHLFCRTYYHRILPKCICQVLGPGLPLGSINFEISGMQFLILLGNAIRDSSTHSQEKIDIISEAFFEAIKHENFNFVLMLINSLKPIVHFTNDEKRNMYMFAIAHRRAKIFSLYFCDRRDEAYDFRGDKQVESYVMGDKRVVMEHMISGGTSLRKLEPILVGGDKLREDEVNIRSDKHGEVEVVKHMKSGGTSHRRVESCLRPDKYSRELEQFRGPGKHREVEVVKHMKSGGTRHKQVESWPRPNKHREDEVNIRSDKHREVEVVEHMKSGGTSHRQVESCLRPDKYSRELESFLGPDKHREVEVVKHMKSTAISYKQVESTIEAYGVRGGKRDEAYNVKGDKRDEEYDVRGDKQDEAFVRRDKRDEAYDRGDKRDKAYDVRGDKRDEAHINPFLSFDDLGNNLLHMVGASTPPISKLVPQMKRELMWFKEVEKLVPEVVRKSKNSDGKTPQELFKESHKDLMMEAGKLMKESVSSWAIVGPLVITIMFAAAFQLPGGSIQEKWLFKVYMVLVAISLFSATISLLKFLEILSTNYEEDFLASLRTYNVIIGTLFLSLAAMLVAFCMGLFLGLPGVFLRIAATFLVGYIICTKLPLMAESLNIFTFEEVKIPFIKGRTSIFDRNIGHEVELIFKMLNRDGQQRR